MWWWHAPKVFDHAVDSLIPFCVCRTLKITPRPDRDVAQDRSPIQLSQLGSLTRRWPRRGQGRFP
jgi:hypothetical protein